MIGAGATGELALGEVQAPAVTSNPFIPPNFATSSRIRSSAFVVLGSSAVLLAAIPFVNLPQAQARSPKPQSQVVSGANLGLFTPFIPRDFSNPRFSKSFARDQVYPNLVLRTFSAPFTPIDWGRPRSIKPAQVPVLTGFHILHQPIPDLHDGVFVKKRSKRKDWRDPIELEIEERAKRRAALELAIYGPEPSILEPKPVDKPVIADPPNVEELAKVILAAIQAKSESIRAQNVADDEDDLESILREIL